MPKRSAYGVILAILFLFLTAGFVAASEGGGGADQAGLSVAEVKDPFAERKPSFLRLNVPAEKPEPAPEAETVAERPAEGEKDRQEANGRPEKNGRQEDQDLMEAALALVEESQAAWKEGDLERALDLLDDAYALVLDADGDPDVARQKDDLRLLVARRILAIYTSTRTEAKGKRGEIPLLMNADVEKEIRSFQTVERNFFLDSYRRSGMYRPAMVRQLKQAGLPEELSWLPLVESGFKIRALSSARALGLWQFIPSTGYKYGLNRTDWVDERMDPDKSTRAAIDYLRALHEMFGDWLTVLASYNCGEGRVLRVISQQKLNYLDRFWDLYHLLPYETARYVPRFLATLHIIRDPQKYGMELPAALEKEIPHETLKVNRPMKLADIAARIETSEETLIYLNPELRHDITPDQAYDLRVPIEKAEVLAAKLDEIPRWELPAPDRDARGYARHRVKRGESLASIARRYRTTTTALRSCNPSLKKRLRVGQSLVIPVARKSASRGPGPVVRKGAAGAVVSYRVKKGDTLSELAERFDTTPDEIRQRNRLKGDVLPAGRLIKVPRGKGVTGKGSASGDSGGKTYTVKRGDNLYRIAVRNGTSVDKLRKANNLGNGTDIHPGQVIQIR